MRTASRLARSPVPGKRFPAWRVDGCMDARPIIDSCSRLAFAGASIVLVLMSIGLVVFGGWEATLGLTGSFADASTALLAAIGYVVIALAVFDVAKYFI